MRPRWRRRDGRFAVRTSTIAPPEAATRSGVTEHRPDVFQGRQCELRMLIERHDVQRRLRDGIGSRAATTRAAPSQATVATGDGRHNLRVPIGPVVLLVHGMPGVGKSALAERLARELSAQYPDGLLVVNLGAAGQPRGAAQVLESLSNQLQPRVVLQGTDVPSLVRRFRSVTAGRHMLFVFDSATDPEQVRELLPASETCVVIVTSRQDFGSVLGVPSMCLGVPDLGEALDMLRAASRTSDGVRPECAVELVELCGRLPLAIRTVGDRVSLDGTDLCDVADLLRPEGTRLEWLNYGGRSVRERIESDYHRLPLPEQRALSLLTLLESPTFVPWVLAPLVGISFDEADSVMAELHAVQLLSVVSAPDDPADVRYALHPLFRLVARASGANELPSAERKEAKERLQEAYMELSARVLDQLAGEERGLACESIWFSDDRRVVPAICRRPDRWIRAEFRNLVPIVQTAHDRRQWDLCWRLAVRLGGCVDDGVRQATVLDAFGWAKKAAEQCGTQSAKMEVLLAYGAFNAAVERYDEAQQAFQMVIDEARIQRQDSVAPQAARRIARFEARATRRIAESYMQMADFREAGRYLVMAYQVAEDAQCQEEKDLIRLLQAENHHAVSARPSYGSVLDEPRADDNARYRAHLGLAESARRRGDVPEAVNHLDLARAFAQGNTRRAASIEYRTARLYFEACQGLLDDTGPWPHESPGRSPPPVPRPASVADRMIRHAARAVLYFRKMEDELGVIRARALLSRTMTAAGFLAEAGQIVSELESRMVGLRSEAEDRYPLRAAVAALDLRVKLARSEWLIRLGDSTSARELLAEVGTMLSHHGDWSEQAYVLRLLGQLPHRPAELATVLGEPMQSARGAEVAGILERLELRLAWMAEQLHDDLTSRIRRSSRPTPVNFVGALWVGLANAVRRESEDGSPLWEVPAAVACELAVTVALGRAYYGGDRTRLPAMPDDPLWRPAAVTSGRTADVADVELIIDAPFLDVAEPRHRTVLAVSSDTYQHRTTLTAPNQGRYDLRVAILSHGRLVQAIPVHVLVADDAT